MNTTINTNIGAINTHRSLQSIFSKQNQAQRRLSSGLRINGAADDAAGLSISEKMRNQIRGLDQATRNTQDGISLVQTADGTLEEVHRMAERIRELTAQASNDTYTPDDRVKIWREVDNLLEEIDRITANAEFNEIKIFRGDFKYELKALIPAPIRAEIRAYYPFTASEQNPIRIPNGTVPTQFFPASSHNSSNIPNSHLELLGNNFPKEGLFIIRVTDPHNELNPGTHDFVLDFEKENINGNMTRENFEAFFQNLFDEAFRPATTTPKGNGVTINTEGGKLLVQPNNLGGSGTHVTVGLTATPQFVIDGGVIFDENGRSPEIIQLSRNNTWPKDTTITQITPTTQLANSAILGAVNSGGISTNFPGAGQSGVTGMPLNDWISARQAHPTLSGFPLYPHNVQPITPQNQHTLITVPDGRQLTQVEINREALAFMQTQISNCPIFFASLPDSFSLSFDVFVQQGNISGFHLNYENASINGGNWQRVHTTTVTLGQIRQGASANPPLTLESASERLNSIRTELGHAGNFSRMTFSLGSSNVDRDGNIVAGIQRSATLGRNLSGGGRRFGSIGGSNAHAQSLIGGSSIHVPSGVNSVPNVISNFPAKVSDNGIFRVNISGGSTNGQPNFTEDRFVEIDFANKTPEFLNLLSMVPSRFPTNEHAMAEYITMRLNEGPLPLREFPKFHHTNGGNQGYDATNFPIGRASIDNNGNLVIQAAERMFHVRIEERMSDKPMFVNRRGTARGQNGHTTIDFPSDDGIHRNVTLTPGYYTNIDDFINANAGNFNRAGLTISQENGQLIVNTIYGGDGQSFDTITPNTGVFGNRVSSGIDFNELLEKLGFGSLARINQLSNADRQASDRNSQQVFIDGTYDRANPIRQYEREYAGNDFWIQSGANAMQGFTIKIPAIDRMFLGLRTFSDDFLNNSLFGDGKHLSSMLNTLDEGINRLSRERANLGAWQNRMEHTIERLRVSSENQSAANSRIRDADMAREMMNLTKADVLKQAGITLLAQANNSANNVLMLLE
ncbi:MAG: hypothetical protein FWF57_09695 [Defluviitaleaceae bacterium]|nr:hypothetical protein [Defluviitaleaceae bacterium]